MGRIEDEIAKLGAELDALDHAHVGNRLEREAYLAGLIRAAMHGEGEEDYPAEEVEKVRGKLERLRPAFERVVARLSEKGWVLREDGTWGPRGQ